MLAVTVAQAQADISTLPHVPGTDPSSAVLDNFRIRIAVQVQRALPNLPLEQIYQGIIFSARGTGFTIPLARFRLGGKPSEWARKVIHSFLADDYIESAKQSDGFVIFRLRTPTLARVVLTQVNVLTNRTAHKIPKYGSNLSGEGRRVIIEYSSPDIAKQFDVRDLRSTIIGGFLCNVYRENGWDVVGMNYLGDWGRPFGMIAVGFAKYGSEQELSRNATKHLYEVYAKINEDAKNNPSIYETACAYSKRMENGDETALSNWRKWRDLLVLKYHEEYERLSIYFDIYSGESQVGAATLRSTLKKLQEVGLVSTSEGAQVLDLENSNLGKKVIQKQDGTSLYLARHIASAVERYETYKFDKMLHVIESQQELHCARFTKALELMGYTWASSLEHVGFGTVLGPKRRKKSTIFLDDIISETASSIRGNLGSSQATYSIIGNHELVLQEVAIASIKIQDMAVNRINNYRFNLAYIASFRGDTGAYLQYSHASLSSILRKNPELLPLPEAENIQTDHLTEPQAHDIVFLLATYPDVVRIACLKNESSGVVTFAMRLAHAISKAWDVLRVKGLSSDQIETARARVWLFLCARDVLGAAMCLLTIRPLE
ncbi:arginyl-tRNA synthetase [Ceratobasidium sp. AG-I]|nr:arginyl-tRNA synthetase [Ceratobasidium sp. AG-I]